MDLRIVRNFLVGMTPCDSRLSEVVRANDTAFVPRIGWVYLQINYTPNKINLMRVFNVSIKVREDADEKYVAKQFLKQIEDYIP